MYSNGWLHRFKTRHRITKHVMSGESASVNPISNSQEVQKLNDMFAMAGYEASNVYNMDETGLFYRLLPSR